MKEVTMKKILTYLCFAIPAIFSAKTSLVNNKITEDYNTSVEEAITKASDINNIVDEPADGDFNTAPKKGSRKHFKNNRKRFGNGLYHKNGNYKFQKKYKNKHSNKKFNGKRLTERVHDLESQVQELQMQLNSVLRKL